MARIAHLVLVGFLVLSFVLPVPAWSAGASLGTARGVRGVELSLDGGKTWLSLGSGSLPVVDGARIRATSGGALLDLGDGSRVSVLPFSAVSIRDSGRATEISLLYGRLTFRLPVDTRLEIRTSLARLEAVRKQVMVGEVVVSGAGTMALQMKEGRLQVHELSGSQRLMVASLEPVFLPKRPASDAPVFSSEAPATPPATAKGVFSPPGESIGYLRDDSQLVIHPGFTNDLTRPFAARLVQLAMARIPETHRSDAMPLFDVNGGFVGYLAGPAFYAQAQIAQGQIQVAQGAIGGGQTNNTLLYAGAGLVLGGGLTIGGLCLADEWPCEEDEVVTTVGTPLRPRR